VALLQCTDTVIAVARPVGAEETATSGTDKSVPYASISVLAKPPHAGDQ